MIGTNKPKGITTINTWSQESVSKGYEPITEEFDLTNLGVELFEEKLNLADDKITPDQRDAQSIAVPGQNLLPNALFKEQYGSPKNLYYWTFTDKDDKPIKVNDRLGDLIPGDADSKAIKITKEDTLRLDRIAVPKNSWLHFSMENVVSASSTIPPASEITMCTATLKLYDQDGKLVESTATPLSRPFTFSEGFVVDSFPPSGGHTLPGSITKTFATTSINTITASYAVLEFINNDDSDCYIRHPMLQLLPPLTTSVDGNTPFAFFSYDDQKYPSYKTPESYPRSGQSCCPQDSCWNGYACIASMSDTLLAEPFQTTSGKKYYRCVAGTWTELPLLHDWNYDKSGFCQSDNQCFVVKSSSEIAGTTARAGKEVVANRTEGVLPDKVGFTQQTDLFYLPTCINSTEYLFDHYCTTGDWSSRTKILAEQLLEYAEEDDYTLYCTTPKKAVLDTPNLEGAFAPYILGGASTETAATPASDGGIVPTVGGDAPGCFNLAEYSDSGDTAELIPSNENTCVNNFCILKKKNGDETKTIIATTLNKPVDDPNTFLNTLDDKFKDITSGTDETTKPCYTTATDKATLDCDVPEGSEAGLKYIPQIEAIIYGKEGIEDDLTWDEAMDIMIAFIEDFLGLEDESEAIALLESHLNVRELYSLRADDKTASVIKENLVKDDDILLWAEYNGFETPLCRFVKISQLPEELRGLDVTQEFQEGLPGTDIFSCFDDGDKKQVVLRTDKKDAVDWLFPQLSGKLRVETTD
ncbi:hypothetical protein HYU21_00810 [Candidatus Woesearchaeota archaeon]|nr:hypothetical protein [Candidatus Woesearchaeota archaeon]